VIAPATDAGFGTYQSAVLVGLGATIAIVLLHATVVKSPGEAERTAPRLGLLARLSWLGALSCVLVLGATAFGTVLIRGAMHGLPLLLHVLAGGGLTVALALVALTWVRTNHIGGAVPRFPGLTRLAFWFVLLLGLIAGGTMLASTFALAGTEGMERLVDVHRWSGLGMFLAAVLHAYLVRRHRRG